jgi:putative ABC transport system permease protein
MIILARKAMRDLRRAKLRTVSIILAIMISVGLGIGLVNATKNAFESFDKRYDVTNYEDIDIQFEMTNLNISEIGAIEGVEEVIGRLYIPTQVQIGNERFETSWISAPYYDKKPYSKINGYQLTDGKYVSSPLVKEALAGNLFAKENGLDVGDELSIYYQNLTIELEVVGIAASPEYIYVIGEGGWPQPSLLLPLFTTYEMTIDTLNLESGTYNELLVKVKSGYDKTEVKQQLEGYLSGQGIKITKSLLGTEEADYLFSTVDAGAMGPMGWAFGIIILCVTAVVIYNSMTRLIAAQRPYIGVMGALGGKSKNIVLHYCLFGLFMGVLGSILGVFIGIGLSIVTVYEYSEIIGLVEPDYTIYWIYPLAFSIIGISISTGAAFLGSLKVLKIGPREALTSQYQSQVFSKKPLVERLIDRFGRKKSVLSRVPLRNLARHKLRTGVTIIALAFSLILVFVCLAMAFGFDQPLQKNYDEYEKWDLKATFADKQDMTMVSSTLAGPTMDGIQSEPQLDDFLPVLDGDEMEFVHIQAFREDSNMRNFNIIEGKKDFNNGILAGSIIAKDLDLEVGSKVTFLVGTNTTTFTVTGITGELLDDSFLMTLDQAKVLFGSENVVNALVVDMGSKSREDVESVLRNNFAVASFSYTEDVINGMESLLEGLISMFFIFIVFGVIAEILFISTTVILNILDRDMEFISLRAMGANPGRIRRMIINESLLLLLGGLVIGLPLAYYSTQWAMRVISQDLMYYEMEIGIAVYVLTALIALISTVIAAFISSRHIIKQKLVDSIRQRTIA